MSMQPSAHPWIAGYLAPYNGRTHHNYTCYLRRWGLWLASRGVEWEAATRQDIEAWRAHLATGGMRAHGIRSALGPVRGLYRWAVQAGHLDRDPAYLVRLPRTINRSQRSWLDPVQLAAFLTYVDEHADPAMRASIYMWSLCGMRPAEPRGVQITDIGRYDGRTSVGLSHRKAGGAERITVAPAVAETIAGAAGDRATGPLLLNENTGQVISKEVTRNRFVALVHGADVPPVSPYGLRTGFITMALAAGVPEREVMYYVGHTSSMQTAYYDRQRTSIETTASATVAAHVHAAAT